LRTYAHSQFLCDLARFDIAKGGVRPPVQPPTFYARSPVTRKGAGGTKRGLNIFLPPGKMCWTLPNNVKHRLMSGFSSDILTRSAGSLYSVQ